MANTPPYWNDATTFLSAEDSVLASIIRQYTGETLQSRGDAFYSLARSIVGQQISVAAADTIWNRFTLLADHRLTPEHILSLKEEVLRTAGLSRQKVTYLHHLSACFLDGTVTPEHFHDMDDEQVINELVKIKGIGKWSAEMFLIFCLMRQDVLPVDDIGLQKAVERHYRLSERPSKKELAAHGEKWRPYRSVATWYLWRSLDPVPVEY